MLDFYMPVKVVSGKGAVVKNAALLRELGRRCLIVTGGSSARLSGALDDAKTALEQEGVAFEVFDKIGPNPLLSACREAGEAARRCGAEFILGIGGGSPLDAAKAVAIYAANEDLAPADIYKRVYNNKPLPLALIGTTAGTGSEVTAVSVLTDDATGRKKSISGPDCYAALALADAKYTGTMPYDITVSTALDAFSHIAEAWFTPNCRGITTVLAREGLRLLWPAMKRLLEEKTLPDEPGRDRLYFGSLYAGLVINTCGTGFPHPLGYVLTENYGVPHGKACAAFLPAYLERAKKHEPRLLEEFLGVLGEEYTAVTAAVNALTALPRVRMTPEQAAAFAARWHKAPPKNFATSPGGLTALEAADILAEI